MRTAYTTVQAAQTRKQLYALCQQLIADATRYHRHLDVTSGTAIAGSSRHGSTMTADGVPLVEVEVREHGRRVWYSAGCSEAELDETEVAVEAVDEDVQAVRKRAQRAFKKTVDVYKAKLESMKEEVARWREEAASKSANGSAYRKIVTDLEEHKTNNRQLSAKVKALLKLLERAGATIKHQEEQHEQEQAVAATGAGFMGAPLDWESARSVIPDLIIEDREGPGILAGRCRTCRAQRGAPGGARGLERNLRGEIR
jgi:hypothetical protein